MPRADPAYLQHLERNSMLAKASEMAKVVSGSELAWRASSNDGSADSLLNFADVWLYVHPLTLLTSSRNSVFSQLADSTVRAVLREIGAKGLYVAPIQGGGALWAKEGKGEESGEDVVQYDFSRAAGKDDQYRRLMSSVIDNQSLLGSDLVPAATGIGPDFFLAARNVREFPGIYCMVDIPDELWANLPEVASEWEGAPLNAEQVAALNAKGLLPKSMRDEVSPLGHKGGWAATGKVRGVDGNARRWVYRYHQNPRYPVLNWEDPSQTAHRILSGSAVRQVGMQGQAFIGLRFEAFQGLEAASGGKNSFSVEPAISAAQSMSREIKRYGGWSWVRDDDLPLDSLNRFLLGGTDFIFDSAFSPAAEHALLTGDASLARFMADELIRLNVDARRLVHASPAQEGINYSLPYLSYLASHGSGDKAAAFRQQIQSAMQAAAGGNAQVKDGYLYTTGAGLASLALKTGSADASQSQLKEIIKGHSLLIFFKAMQPGVVMLSGQDLVGAMPLASPPNGDPASSCRGSYALTSSGSGLVVTNMDMPKAPQLYAAPDAQAHQKESFLGQIGAFLHARTQHGLGKASLVARPQTKGKGSIALVSRLPDGKRYLLSVCNFSRESVTETISLADVAGIGSAMSRATPIATGGSHSISGKTVTVSLGPWQGRALVLGSGSAKGDADGKDDGGSGAGAVTPIPQ